MVHLWNGRVSKSHLSAISTLVFHHTAAFLLLTHCCGGQSQMVGPSKTILAMIDDDIMLPCHLEPATDVVARTLEWARLDLNPRFVHVRRDGVELLVNQNPSYMGRTSVSTDRLKHGDISLKLSKVKVSDEGKYRCHIPALGTSAVDLVVGALSSPVVIIAEIDKPIRRVVLQCESKGWYPEPEVLWLDGEGNLLSAGPPETVRGPDDLYTVSSRVTVEKRHSNSFTCRVQQKNINQTRETEIRILEDVLTASSCSAVRIIVVLSVCFLFSCISAAFFVYGKQRQNKRYFAHCSIPRGVSYCSNHSSSSQNNKVHRDNVTKTLQEKEEEHKDMLHVVSVLKEHKKELEISKGKQILQLEKVVEERRENDKKLKKIDRKYSWDKDSNKSTLLVGNLELDKKRTEYQSSLPIIVEKIQKTEDVISRMTERKNKVENQIEQIKKQLETKRWRESEEIQLKQQSEKLEREETNTNIDSLTSTEGHSSRPLE